MTKEIQLTYGRVTLVDDDDYKELNKYKWHVREDGKTFYAQRSSSRRDGPKHIIRMHRQILGLTKSDGKIGDHINRDGLDNRRENLRIVSCAGNSHNHGMHKFNKSGHTGVWWFGRDKLWHARITSNNKNINLGYYPHINDAIEARRLGEIEHWGAERRR